MENKSITIDNATLVWKRSRISKGCAKFKGQFLSYGEFSTKSNISTNYIQYFQFISAIPSDLEKKAAYTDCWPLILLRHAVKIITSCLIISAELSQVELKSGRRNSLKYWLIGLISFKTYIALRGIINSVNFLFSSFEKTKIISFSG